MRNHGARAEEHTPHVDPDHLVELARSQIHNLRKRPDPGIVNKYIDGAELLDCLGDQHVDVKFLGDIGPDRECSCSYGLDLLGHGVNFRQRPGCNDHAGSLPGQRKGDGFPDAASRAGNDRDLVLQLH